MTDVETFYVSLKSLCAFLNQSLHCQTHFIPFGKVKLSIFHGLNTFTIDILGIRFNKKNLNFIKPRQMPLNSTPFCVH